jgi:hypothetical protein
MKTNIIAVAGIGLLVLFVAGFASIFEIKLASAQVDATSTIPVDPSMSTTTLESTLVTASTDTTAVATSTDTTTSDTQASTTIASQTDAVPPKEAPPAGMAKVHIIGMKYTDYFTDGTTTFAFPGDPTIDSRFDVPNAPIPTHEGLTWVHTTGGYLYDTPSGDLEVGDYAVLRNGLNIVNAPPFVSSTSTPAQIASSTTSSAAADTSSSPSNDVSSSVPDASTSTVSSPTDNSSSTTTSSESTPTL